MKNKKFISMLPLETIRLIIRLTTTNDIDILLKMDKQEITQKYLGGVKNKSREERIVFLEKKEKKFKEGDAYSFTIFLKNEKPIGFIELDINENEIEAELSYIFDYDYCNNGYCTEACKKNIKHRFL